MTKKKIVELNPTYASAKDGTRFLIIDCPECGNHGIAIVVAGDPQKHNVCGHNQMDDN
jgi:ribosomal protein S27E